jgi:hypothetical protein
VRGHGLKKLGIVLALLLAFFLRTVPESEMMLLAGIGLIVSGFAVRQVWR